jgi:4a-hydroxytetrahydrobiopterin dehydratase
MKGAQRFVKPDPQLQTRGISVVEALYQQRCEVCQVGAPPATEQQRETFLKQLPDWEIIEMDSVPQLSRDYRFKDFKQAMVFARGVADLAEAVGHHPALLVEWGKVNLRWWTHKIHNLHESDFIMAARCDQLYRQQ